MGVNFYRRRKTDKVYVYYKDPKTGKPKQVKRKLTEGWDKLNDDEVEQKVKEWADKNGHVVENTVRRVVLETDKLNALWKQYQEQKAADFTESTGRRTKTIKAETSLFYNHIAPYFVGQKEKKDPKQWAPFVPEFHQYLIGKNLKASTRRAVLWVLKRFSESLVFSGYMTSPFAIRPPKSKLEKVTPLKVRKSPEDIIAFAKKAEFTLPKNRFVKGNDNTEQNHIDFVLAVLLGYFGGFGPGELFALSKADLLTGDNAIAHTKTYLGFKKHGIGSKLSVVINKTLPVTGDVVPLVKNDYRFGVSNIWHVEAARLIAKIVKDKPDGRLFPFSYSYLITMWREHVRPKLGATPHDLRRASGLHLGRKERIELTLLQEHMRHADISTTMLYCREPVTPEKSNNAKQNFDDVA